ncbi:MAG TPA: hypothetical protein H9902_07750 [Candidatus Stackebrandtia faecavium]|nr:hypothetical protein [Candidatus Stackebrandtia faecavium]
MSSRWFSMVVDAHDHRRLARWWAEVLDYRVVHEEMNKTMIADVSFPPDGIDTGRRTVKAEPAGPGILFVATAEGTRPSGGRIHLDLNPGDHDAELERLLDMGARHVQKGNRPSGSMMLADPEGNTFCVMTPIRQAEAPEL